MRYTFSGHESFVCKSMWLKKGYDFLQNNYQFQSPKAVVRLGVGKNMVSSIRFWLKSFGMIEEDKLTELAHYFFDNIEGRDLYVEDITTLWLLHYSLIKTNNASLYNLLFLDFHREKREFDKKQIDSFIQRKCNVSEQKNVYNANTLNKDIQTLFRMYVTPDTVKELDDFSSIFLPLGLIQKKNSETYFFTEVNKENIDPIVILYVLLDLRKTDKTLSFDVLQKISLIFCISMDQLIIILKELSLQYPDVLHYTDNSGVKNVQFLSDLDKFEALDKYYNKK